MYKMYTLYIDKKSQNTYISKQHRSILSIMFYFEFESFTFYKNRKRKLQYLQEK